MEKLFDVVYEDDELLVVNKPAGLVCHPTKGDVYSSLISRVRLYLGDQKPAHMINRLDRETSGVILLAKDPKSAGALGKLWESRSVKKEYLAIVHGYLKEDAGTIDAALGADEQSIVHVKDCVRADGAASRTDFRVERRFQNSGKDFSLLQVMPQTGRKHQIRIHLQHLGHPIVGDKLYGGDELIYLALAQGQMTDAHRATLILPNQALHAEKLSFEWQGEPKTFSAAPEKSFSDFAAGVIPTMFNDGECP